MYRFQKKFKTVSVFSPTIEITQSLDELRLIKPQETQQNSVLTPLVNLTSNFCET
jgi:hypothetical protein